MTTMTIDTFLLIALLLAIVFVIILGMYWFVVHQGKCTCGKRVWLNFVDCSPCGQNPLNIRIFKTQWHCNADKGGCGKIGSTMQ